MNHDHKLRPYYNADTFSTPIKGSGGAGVAVYRTSSGFEPVPISKASNDSFVYLDVDSIGAGAQATIKAIGSSMLALYNRTLLAQPWEASKLILQVGSFAPERDQSLATDSNTFVDELGEKSDDEDGQVNYFGDSDVLSDLAVSAGLGPSLSNEWSRMPVSDATKTVRPTDSKVHTEGSDPILSIYTNLLAPKSRNILDVVFALNDKEGIRGVFRALHSSFIADALQSLGEAWFSGFFSALAGIPDPEFVDILQSPSPMMSLCTAVAASVVTAIFIAPLSMIRTRLIVTTFETEPRSFRKSLAALKSPWAPSLVLFPTILNSGFSCALRRSTPYLLYMKLGIDKTNAPAVYNLLTLVSNVVELTIKLPLETMMRRAHVAVSNIKPSELIVYPVAYTGMLPTLWSILNGNSSITSLYDGWRFSLMGVLGDWGVNALQQDTKRERF